jgi:hypothetical protein
VRRAGGSIAEYVKKFVTRQCLLVDGLAYHQVVLNEYRFGAFDQHPEGSRLTLAWSRGAAHSNEWGLEPATRMATTTRGISAKATTERQVVGFDVGRPRAGMPISVRHHRTDANVDQIAKADATRSIVELPFRQR